ncbi:MAG: hypothetical protein NUV86_07935, partial [Candidatus Scalindua sp.]|nr:hypothetical protein [Candidatus Scalindua sp.]MCR4344613.1 hypothetical protein [Candidatus Scalindua sp.]
MRKLSVKIAILLFAILITIIAAISTLVFLINSEKLTHFLEHRIKTDTNFDIKIKDTHLNIFSCLQLKQISVKWLGEQKQFTLECNTIALHYNLFDLLKRRIKGIDISDVQIIINAEMETAIGPPSSHDYGLKSFSLKDIYPEHLLVENISVNNTQVKITAGDYLFELTEMDMQVKEIQPTKPFYILMNGNFSVSNPSNETSSNLYGEIDIITKYSLPDDELIILNNSHFLVNDSEKFLLNGKAFSILTSPEIHCNISGNPHLEAFNSMIPENYKDWSLNGTISTDTSIDYIAKNQSWTMAAITDMSISKLGFASPDYDYFVEKISGHIKISLNTDSNSRKLSFVTNGMLEPFLIQLGDFTTNMRNRKTHFSLNGNYDTQNKNLNEVNSTLSWDNLGTITTVGDILSITDNPHLDMNIELKKIDNSAFFETFAKDTVEYSNP